ncbi:MAG: AAA family ATPase, partial [Cyclobacteriaceae bacterium]
MAENSKPQAPLAERLRPASLDDLIGQQHLVGTEGIIRKAVNSGSIPSMILWGPPGVGKTTIANIIANQVKATFYTLSAISSGVKEVREVITKARFQGKTLLFIDEIHRFSKSQQDALLGAVEKGTITLIGATTENPSFEVISALLSRCQVYTLQPLQDEDLLQLMTNALHKDEWLQQFMVKIEEHRALINISGGDARKLLNLLELTIESYQHEQPLLITDQKVVATAHQRVA